MPPLADGFTDRLDTVRGLGEALGPGATVALVPGSAFAEGPRNWLGASGKTQLAVYLAESLWRSGSVDVLVWIAATSRAAMLAAYMQAWAAATGLEPAGSAESVAARFVGWMAATTQSWLVVLDDLSDTTDVDGLWPEGPTGRVVVTTAQSALTAGQRRMRVFPVGFFSVREALGSLTERLNANPAQRQGAIDLIETLGREPLALAQSCSVIANSTVACRDYRDYFLRRRQQTGVPAGEVPSAGSITWTLSFGQAEQLLPGESIRLMLALVALLDGHGIPGVVFNTSAVSTYLGGVGPVYPSAVVDPKRAWDALLALERVGLVSVNRAETPPTIRMNPVVQAAIRQAAPAQMRERAARAAASALLEAWPAEEPHPWTAASLRSNTVNLQRVAADLLWTDGCHPVLLRAGRSFDEGRFLGPAVDHWRELAAFSDNMLQPVHPDAQLVAASLAAAYLAAGRGADAVSWYQRVLAERARTLAPGHPAIITARVSLGRALIQAGESGDAITVLRAAVGECEQFRGPGHPDTLGVRDELAAAYQAAGKPAEAIRLYQRTLADRERMQGPRDVETMATRDRLAAAWFAEGKIKDALTQYKRLLTDRERVLGTGHPDTIATRGSLAAVYHAAGRMPSAVQMSEQACTDSENLLGADHPDTLSRRANLAHLYYAVGRIGDAKAVLRDTVTRCERVLPADDPITKAVHQSLANIAGE